MILVMCLVAPALACGKEIAPGTVLDKGNIDALLNDTFEGKPIKSLLTENMLSLVRKNGLVMRLGAAKPIEVDRKWIEAAKRNASAVTFDAKTRTLSGWKVGLPFPQI